MCSYAKCKEGGKNCWNGVGKRPFAGQLRTAMMMLTKRPLPSSNGSAIGRALTRRVDH